MNCSRSLRSLRSNYNDSKLWEDNWTNYGNNAPKTITGNPENIDSRSTDPHYWPGPRTTPTNPSTDHPQNKIKKFPPTACRIDHCVGEISSVTLGKCNRPEFSLGRKLHHWYSTLPFSFAVAISIYERAGNLQKASKFVLLWMHFLHQFVRPILPWVRSLVPGFTIWFVEFQS